MYKRVEDARASEDQTFPRAYIIETLEIYQKEHIYLNSATWKGNKLRGLFRFDHYPFIRQGHKEYLPASMLMLFLSQLGYIYARVLCEKDALPMKISAQDFFRLRDEGNILFVGFDKIKFNQRLYTFQSPLSIEMKLHRALGFKGKIIGDLLFDVSAGTFTGQAKWAMLLGS